jgi:Ca2+-binding EF-hand superfamily protein
MQNIDYLIQKIKYKIYSEPTQPYNYTMYLDERETNIICLYTTFTRKNIKYLEKIFQMNQTNGMINKNEFMSLIICSIPNKTLFYNNIFINDKSQGIDIIKFILILSIMYKKSNFARIERLIFDIIDIKKDGLIDIEEIKLSFITNNNKYNNKTIFTVIIKDDKFNISLNLFVEILIQELFYCVKFPKTFITFQEFMILLNESPYYKIILHMFNFTNTHLVPFYYS